MRFTRPLMTLCASALMAFSAASTGWSSDLQDLSAKERDAFRAEVRAYLLDNPEVLMEAISVLEQRQAQQAEVSDRQMVTDNAAALFETSTDLVLGNPNGDITIVEFLDYRCGYCKKAPPEVNALLENDGNIKLIVKEFPILGDASVLASRFAIATHIVAGDAAYADVHEALMNAGNNVTEGSLKRLLRGTDVDVDAVMETMNSEEVTKIIVTNRALGQAMQISGTPSFVFETEMLRGYVPYDRMIQLVTELRAEG